ncbi:MAG: nuclease, partial [Thioclava marina]|nr:nuclease [Thioclava marina]
MARKRLGPARDFGTDPDPEIDEAALAASPESKAMFPRGAARLASHAAPPLAPPIARVSGEAAAHAAAERLADDIRAAREGGRLVVDLALEDVAEAWLLRDRISADPEELEVLKTSLRERGQQAPIEVMDLGPAAAPRYGLVS